MLIELLLLVILVEFLVIYFLVVTLPNLSRQRAKTLHRASKSRSASEAYGKTV